MIPIVKEGKELFEQFKCYERCFFCGKETDMWHDKSNTPVCKECSKKHKVSELKIVKAIKK